MPKLTLESLEAATRPPNGCQVAKFRAALGKADVEVFDAAIKMPKDELSGPSLRQWLIASGYDETKVPSVDHIQAHRVTRRPCRCFS